MEVVFAVAILVLVVLPFASAGHNYREALSKSILFFEAQRSGHLPFNQRVKWRSHSGLLDGKTSGVDLVGGYYDAGDNVKFGLPMAFTITMMSWSIIEYGKQILHSGELSHSLASVKWGTDYLIKAHPEPNVLYGEVGDGVTDHYCWQRPEDMTTSRAAYRLDAYHPGSDLAGETAAAMASASIVFRRLNPAYSKKLLSHAKQLFSFADRYRGKYDRSISVARKYYGSVSGYADELLWAASWLYQATNERYYLDYLGKNADSLGGTGWAMTEFSWEVKYAGVQVMASKILMQGKAGHHTAVLKRYQQKAEYFMCSCLGKGTRNVRRTPGGLLFRQRWNNLQFVTSASFLMTVYSDYLSSHSGRYVRCASGNATPLDLINLAKSQVDYILGDNPRGTSYMVGYGKTYPQRVHHRGSSIVSIKVNSAFVSCRGGYSKWYGRKASDPNLLSGAIVGGPDGYDNFADERDNYEQTEPATYNNAPLIGVLARLAIGHVGRNQLFPVSIAPTLWRKTSNPIHHNTNPSSHHSVSKSKPASITVNQRVTSSWKVKGRTYYRYSTIVTNNSLKKTITDLKFAIANLYGPLWGLTYSNKSYGFPKWLKELPAGKSFEFVYIHPSSHPANVFVSYYNLV